MPRDDPITEEERKASSATDLIRMRIERLQKNIHKPVVIPSRKELLRPPKPPQEFVRNVVGSSAAAGSAEFHIYRNNRRKEQNRLDYIEAVAKQEEMDNEYKQKMEALRKEEEQKTAKKRAKRLRKKQAAKMAKRKKKEEEESEESDDSDEDEEEEEESSAEAEEKEESSVETEEKEKSSTEAKPDEE